MIDLVIRVNGHHVGERLIGDGEAFAEAVTGMADAAEDYPCFVEEAADALGEEQLTFLKSLVAAIDETWTRNLAGGS